MDISDLGACLRALRRRADLSQRELAQRAGVPPSTVSRLESGDVSNPRLLTLKQIVEAADGALVISPEASTKRRATDSIEPVPHDHMVDERGRRYPAHLDVRTTFPIFGRDWTLLSPGTPVRTFTLDRRDRDQEREFRMKAASVRIDRSELLPGAAWSWTAVDAGDNAVAHLVAQFWPRLNSRNGYPADAVVGGLTVETGWRCIGIEEKLLGALRDELAGRDVSEVVVIGYRLGDAPYVRALGFRLVSRVASTFSIDLDVLDV